jgi:hypothetical protein
MAGIIQSGAIVDSSEAAKKLATVAVTVRVPGFFGIKASF